MPAWSAQRALSTSGETSRHSSLALACLLAIAWCLSPGVAAAQNDGLNRVGINARAGTLFLTRSNPSAKTYLTEFPGPPVLDASDFHFNTATGWDLGLGVNPTNTWGVDARFFRVDGYNTSGSVTDSGAGAPPGLGVSFSNSPLGNFLVSPVTALLSYRSALTSAELNARFYPLGENWCFLAGFRYINYQDRVNVATVSAGPFFNVIDTETDNNLFGLQSGVEGRLLRWDWFTLDASGKAGVYGNQSRAAFNNLSNFFIGNGYTSQVEGQTSFLGETALTAGVDLTDNITLRLGYQCLWLGGIAVGTDQPSVNSALFPGGFGAPGGAAATDVQTTGAAFYHGALVSLEVRR